MTKLEKQIATLKNKYDRVCETHSNPAVTALGLSIMLGEALEIINELQKEAKELRKSVQLRDEADALSYMNDF